MENFVFLKNDYPDLYLLCSDVAKYIETDNAISMLKARQAIEFIVKYLGAETADLFVNINNLEDKNIANSRIIDLFHLIRKKANKSVHNEINADTEGVLDALIEICVWLAIGYDKKNISIIKFTEKEKFFLKKYGDYKVSSSEEGFEAVDTVNPLEVVGKFSTEEYETADVLEQDVFETYEEYCDRIESMPSIKIGYAFLDPAQIDEYCEIAFPLFHVNKHPKIEAASVAAFYASDIGNGKNIDGIIKAKLKIYEGKIYYDYDSVTLQDDDDNELELFPISWEKYGYETEEQFDERIRRLPLLPVGVAKPIRKEYDLKNQTLPFEIISLSYASKINLQNRLVCSVDRDNAKAICLIKSPFKVYTHFKDLQNIEILQIYNRESDCVLTVYEEDTTIKKLDKSKFELYLFLAKKGNANAQCNLARCYKYSYFVKENMNEAIKWYRLAADNGNAAAQNELAVCYETGEGIDEDDLKAFEWYKKAAEQGYAEAQKNLACYYENGIGTEENEQKAFEWYKKAAESGSYIAQDSLVSYYEDGKGTEKNLQKASEWQKKIDETIVSESIFATDNEMKWVLNIAEQGNVKAQETIALFYSEFSIYDKSLDVEAFKWYKKAAQNGDALAQYRLADCYSKGIGTERDDLKALEWYKRAAKKGYSSAVDKLKLLGEDTIGVSGFNGIDGKSKVLMGNKKFSIAVIGEFSCGKSTFVNALLGKVVLPAGLIPTTTIISKISYGETPVYTIHYRDGMTKQISDIDFLGIKAQRVSDLYDCSKIEYVDIEYPATFCKNNVEVIDTPGTNDLSIGRLEINYGYLKNVDAVVLLLVAGQELSESVKEFLRGYYNEIRKHKFFIVLNKKDELDESADKDQMKQRMMNSLNALGLGDFRKRVFLVSGKQALLYRRKASGETLSLLTKIRHMVPSTIEETGLPEFEKELTYFISEEGA